VKDRRSPFKGSGRTRGKNVYLNNPGALKAKKRKPTSSPGTIGKRKKKRKNGPERAFVDYPKQRNGRPHLPQGGYEWRGKERSKTAKEHENRESGKREGGRF